jgi:hypothetical protein
VATDALESDHLDDTVDEDERPPVGQDLKNALDVDRGLLHSTETRFCHD